MNKPISKEECCNGFCIPHEYKPKVNAKYCECGHNLDVRKKSQPINEDKEDWKAEFRELFQPMGTAIKYINVNNFVVVEAIERFIEKLLADQKQRILQSEVMKIEPNYEIPIDGCIFEKNKLREEIRKLYELESQKEKEA